VNDFFVGHVVGRAGEAGVLAVDEQHAVAIGVASQRGHELAALELTQRAEVHG